MKLIKILLCGAVVGAASLLPASKALADYTPRPKINVSGTMAIESPTLGYGSVLKTSFNNKALISLLNASSTVQRYITNSVTHVTTSNTIPAGSYFVWDIYSDDVWVTNANGFSFDVEVPVSFYIYAYEGELIGSFSLNTNTFAGSEKSVSSIYIYFYDYNDNYFEGYGGGTMNWTYTAKAGNVQKKSVSVKLSPGAYEAEAGTWETSYGLTTSCSVSGSGSSVGLGPFTNNVGFIMPFSAWY